MKPLHLIAAATLCCAAVASQAADPPAKIALKAGCTVCHAPTKKIIGPAFRDVAAKYSGRADAIAMLSKQVRSGSTGVWGTAAMVPNDPAKISDADLKAVLAWVLKTPRA
jgi:cytochrome c